MDPLADGGGTMASAALCTARSPSPRLGLHPGLAQSSGAQKRLAVGRSQWGCDALWAPAFVGAGMLGWHCQLIEKISNKWVKYLTTTLLTPCNLVHECQGKSQESGVCH